MRLQPANSPARTIVFFGCVLMSTDLHVKCSFADKGRKCVIPGEGNNIKARVTTGSLPFDGFFLRGCRREVFISSESRAMLHVSHKENLSPAKLQFNTGDKSDFLTANDCKLILFHFLFNLPDSGFNWFVGFNNVVGTPEIRIAEARSSIAYNYIRT